MGLIMASEESLRGWVCERQRQKERGKEGGRDKVTLQA